MVVEVVIVMVATCSDRNQGRSLSRRRRGSIRRGGGGGGSGGGGSGSGSGSSNSRSNKRSVAMLQQLDQRCHRFFYRRQDVPAKATRTCVDAKDRGLKQQRDPYYCEQP